MQIRAGMCFGALLALAGVMSTYGGCMASGKVLLKTDFEIYPADTGWEYSGENPRALWITGGRSGRCLVASQGMWESPLIPVAPFEYYRVTFYSKAEGRAYWAAVYYDATGEPLVADHYWGIDQSDGWLKNEFCTRARVNATHLRLRFQPLNDKRLCFDNVKVEAISRLDVAKWADAVYGTIPPVNYEPYPDRWKYLPRTMDRLRTGKTLRVVMLGDSIMNDTGNSPWDVLVERLYPGSRIEVVNSVRGATGTPYYRNEGRVKEFVLDFEPDLLVIGGISNGSVDATRSVIQQVRAVIDPEIIVTTEAVCRGLDPTTNSNWRFEVNPRGTSYRDKLVVMARQERVEYLDFTGPWGRYIGQSGRPLDWFQRDETHANLRGAIVLAKILEAYFAPKQR